MRVERRADCDVAAKLSFVGAPKCLNAQPVLHDARRAQAPATDRDADTSATALGTATVQCALTGPGKVLHLQEASDPRHRRASRNVGLGAAQMANARRPAVALPLRCRARSASQECIPRPRGDLAGTGQHMGCLASGVAHMARRTRGVGDAPLHASEAPSGCNDCRQSAAILSRRLRGTMAPLVGTTTTTPRPTTQRRWRRRQWMFDTDDHEHEDDGNGDWVHAAGQLYSGSSWGKKHRVRRRRRPQVWPESPSKHSDLSALAVFAGVNLLASNSSATVPNSATFG